MNDYLQDNQFQFHKVRLKGIRRRRNDEPTIVSIP